MGNRKYRVQGFAQRMMCGAQPSSEGRSLLLEVMVSEPLDEQ